jgi:hypothetical protein
MLRCSAQDKQSLSHRNSFSQRGSYFDHLFFRAALAPSFPRAVRVFLGKWAMVLFRRAARAALLIFRFAVARCFLVVMTLGKRRLLRFQISPRRAQRFFAFRVGLPFRLVFAIRRSSALLIDWYIPLDAPLREDFLRSPRLAAKAAPAAICCFLDFAGIFPPVVFGFSLPNAFRLQKNL